MLPNAKGEILRPAQTCTAKSLQWKACVGSEMKKADSCAAWRCGVAGSLRCDVVDDTEDTATSNLRSSTRRCEAES